MNCICAWASSCSNGNILSTRGGKILQYVAITQGCSLLHFFSEDATWICSALFDLCLVSLHNKLICMKILIILLSSDTCNIPTKHIMCGSYFTLWRDFMNIKSVGCLMKFFALINELCYSLKGNPSRWSSSLIHSDSPLPSPPRHRQGCVWYMADIR